MIKPIETVYKGYRFRSRLEARWAVFFDALGLRWDYEIEGFELNNGEKYLPDFYLMELEFYAEIKPKPFSEDQINKCLQLPRTCLMLDGIPDERDYLTTAWTWGDYDDRRRGYCFIDLDDLTVFFREKFGGRGWTPDNTLATEGYTHWGKWSREYGNAVLVAKSARFEFGDMPMIPLKKRYYPFERPIIYSRTELNDFKLPKFLVPPNDNLTTPPEPLPPGW